MTRTSCRLMRRLLMVVLALLLATGSTARADATGTAPQPPAKTEPAARNRHKTQPVQPAPDHAPAPAPAIHVGWIEISGAILDGPPRFEFEDVDPHGSVSHLVEALHQAATDAQISGLVINLDEPLLELAQVDEIAVAMQKVRQAGRKIVVTAESYDLISYLLACSADVIAMRQHGEFSVAGLGLEEMYLAGTLDKVGAKADMVQIGRFKGAEEPLTRSGPSPEWDRNVDGLLDDLYDQILVRIMAGRRLDRAAAEKLLGEGWSLTDQQLIERKAVDQLVSQDLSEVTTPLWGEDFQWKDLSAPKASPAAGNPWSLLARLMGRQQPALKRQAIAVIHVLGPIVTGASEARAPSAADSGIFAPRMSGSRTIVEAIQDAIDEDRIAGVVLRIDSPGGSALASEMMWQAVRELSQYVPVYASLGGTAASGGYYVASAADRIYVDPSSIVGSIGVVGGKIIFGGLYDKLGLGVKRRSRGPAGDLFNSQEPFNPEQRELVRRSMTQVYDQFLARVREGRGDMIKDVNAVAEGRLFTGRQAVHNGLADEVGGLEQALAAVVKEAGLEPGSYDIINWPPPPTLGEFLEKFLLSMQVRAPLAASPWQPLVQATLNPRQQRALHAAVTGLLLLRQEPVLLIMPGAIVVGSR